MERATRFMANARSFVLSVAVVALSCVVLVALLTQIAHRSIVLELIDTPADVRASGCTPMAFTRALLDRALAIQAAATTTRDPERLLASSTLSDIELPSSKLTVRSVALFVREHVLGNPERTVSGEVLARDGLFSLELRSNAPAGRVASLRGFATVDDLLDMAGEALVRHFDPYILAKYYERLDAAQCKQLALHCLSSDPRDDDKWAYQLLGHLQLAEGDVEGAKRRFEQGLALDPDWANPLHNLGWAHQTAGQFERAVACFREASQRDPKWALPPQNWGWTLFRMGRYEEAAEKLRLAAELDPTWKWPPNNLGLALEALGEYERAVESFRRAMDLDPTWSYPVCSLGRVLLEMDRPEEAVSVLLRASELDADWFKPDLLLGDAWLALGERDSAAESYETAARKAPDAADVAADVIERLRDMGHADRARLVLEHALERGHGELGDLGEALHPAVPSDDSGSR